MRKMIILLYIHTIIGILAWSMVRYKLKQNDKSKSRFCTDPYISKQYERTLY